MDYSFDTLRLFALFGAAVSVGAGAIGSGFGIGLAGSEAAQAIARQPAASGRTIKMMLIGQAVTESPAIFSLLISIFLIFNVYKIPETIMLSHLLAVFSAGFCMGFGAIGSGIGSGFANAMAARGVGTNPDTEPFILRTMIIGQAIAQSPCIFALIVSFSLLFT